MKKYKKYFFKVFYVLFVYGIMILFDIFWKDGNSIVCDRVVIMIVFSIVFLKWKREIDFFFIILIYKNI